MLKRSFHWVGKGTAAVLDEGLYAGATFLVHVLLARWLPPPQYGAFAVAYSVFLLFVVAHNAFLSEPMLVFGPGRFADRFPDYLGRLVSGHGLAALAVAAPLAAAGLVFSARGEAALGSTLLALAVAGPCLLLLWLLRRACYVRSLPRQAATGSGLYCLLLLVALYGLLHFGGLSGSAALLAMAAAGVLASAWLVARLRPRFRRRDVGLQAATVLDAHWRYGRWAAGTGTLTWVTTGNLYLIALPIWVGLDGSAALRALMNLVLPVLHAGATISLLLIPRFVEASREGPSRLRALVVGSAMVFVVGALLYWAALATVGGDLLARLYAHEYDGYAWLLPVIGAVPLLEGIAVVLGGALRAIERPDAVFWGYAVSSLATVTIGLGLVMTTGVVGAVVGLVLGNLFLAGTLAALYLRYHATGSVTVSHHVPEAGA